MKILHLSTWKTGGAAKAGIRLSHALKGFGVDSRITHMSSRIPAYLDAAIGKLTHTTNPIFHSYNYFGQNIGSEIAKFKPDLLHIHWIGAGFITPESLAKFNLPIVWTLHDLWPLCGAEHLPAEAGLPDSTRFQTGYLPSNRPAGESGLDLDRLVWQRKLKAFANLNLTYIAPSLFVKDLALSANSLGANKILYIPNGIDTTIFKPLKQRINHKPIILFVGLNLQLDPNKGYADFLAAVKLLPQKLRNNLEVKVVGGEISSESQMAKLYQQASLTVVPSKLETLSFVTMESMACGTPVVAYQVGGIPDLVDHKLNGYLAKPYDVRDLSRGLEYILTHAKVRAAYSQSARKKILSHFTLSQMAKNYLKIYNKST